MVELSTCYHEIFAPHTNLAITQKKQDDNACSPSSSTLPLHHLPQANVRYDAKSEAMLHLQ